MKERIGADVDVRRPRCRGGVAGYTLHVVLLLRGTSRCSLCDEIISTNDPIVGFTHFLGSEHRLWRYSDSAMHVACYEAWPDKEEFDALHDAAQAKIRSSTAPSQLEALRRQQADDRATQARLDREHGDRHAQIMAVVRAHGAKCPHCSSSGSSFRELKGTARLRLVCEACGRSCDASDLHIGSERDET